MVFTSPAFLFLFLPVFLAVFSLSSRRDRLTLLARLTIIVGTFVFYAFDNLSYLVPFAIATGMDLFWSRLLGFTTAARPRKAIVAASVIQNLGLFFVYKYAQHLPGTGILRNLVGTDGTIPLPPGLSFYLFESLSFVVDCYRREVVAPVEALDFFTFISMFPRFVAGPIVRYADLIRSIKSYRGPRLADGGFVFALGFTIKVLGADSLERVVAPYFGHQIHFFAAWVTALAYAFQIYLDFSGYSLMAIGLGLMIGMPFADNFREPYLARNLTEFWRRWHISLSSWLRDYLYVPLGGNRVGAARAYVNLFVTMLLGGIWHGANETFVIWGAYHGLLLVGERHLRGRGIEFKSVGATFVLVLFGWVYFRAERAHQGLLVLGAMLGFRGLEFSQGLKIIALEWPSLALGSSGIVWSLWFEPLVRRHRRGAPWSDLSVESVSPGLLIAMVVAFVAAVAFASANKKVPFLYFQF